jgi:hypothetical protein
MAVSSFAHREAALLLQAAYSDYQVGAFEDFHQLVENTLIVPRPGPKVVFQYELRFANRLESQLLISHLLLLIKQMPPRKKEREIKPLLGNTPAFFDIRSIFVSIWNCQPRHRGLPKFNTVLVLRLTWRRAPLACCGMTGSAAA